MVIHNQVLVLFKVSSCYRGGFPLHSLYIHAQCKRLRSSHHQPRLRPQTDIISESTKVRRKNDLYSKIIQLGLKILKSKIFKYKIHLKPLAMTVYAMSFFRLSLSANHKPWRAQKGSCQKTLGLDSTTLLHNGCVRFAPNIRKRSATRATQYPVAFSIIMTTTGEIKTSGQLFIPGSYWVAFGNRVGQEEQIAHLECETKLCYATRNTGIVSRNVVSSNDLKRGWTFPFNPFILIAIIVLNFG